MRRSRACVRRAAAGALIACAALLAGAAAAEDASRATALRREALAYEHGEGVDKDPRQAAELYCRAAGMGDAEAQYALGWMYANGRGVERDERLAAGLFALAADQGHDYAQRMLEYVQDAGRKLPECLRPRPVFVDLAPAAGDIERYATTPQRRQIVRLVRKLAPEYKVDPELVLAVIAAESNFDDKARSPKNAQGLMQLIPETSERFNVKDAYDPVQNLRGGLSYLRWLLAYFKGDVALVAAGYNAGEGTVDRYGGVPPYAETREYVKRILEMVRERSHPYDARVVAPSAQLQVINRNAKP
jgi:soluble lytic murein transglycosylase-like protein